jgi:hypothetical protein
VVALYLHRGAFEAVLSDEDQEIDPDRWCSHSPAGQQAWQIVSQWAWNLGLEPAPGTGASASSRSGTHHRVCSRCVRGQRAAAPHLWLWQALGCRILESWPLLWAGLRPPARWHTALSCQSVTCGTRTAQGSRWKPARGLCGQHPQLPPLSLARAVSMEWQHYCEAASGQCALASPRRWAGPCALERLESETSSASVHASASAATRGSAGGAESLCLPRTRACAPVPCTARPLSSRLV